MTLMRTLATVLKQQRLNLARSNHFILTRYPFCIQSKQSSNSEILNATESQSIDEEQQESNQLSSNPDEYQLLYESSFRSALYPIKILSISGCIASLLLTPFICFDPMQFAFLTNVGMVGRFCIGIPVAIFGCGTSLALHIFSKTIVTRMFYKTNEDLRENNIKLQFMTLWLTTITLETNIKNIKCLPPSLGFSNCIDTQYKKKMFLNCDCLPDFMVTEIGFAEEYRKMNKDSIADSDTSWMGKQ